MVLQMDNPAQPKARQQQQKKKCKENLDTSINEPANPQANGESDVEEDEALLEDEETGW